MNLPVFNLLPNEHLLSWLIRSYKLSGYRNLLTFQKSLGFQDRFLYCNKIFTPALKAIILRAKEPEKVIKDHTVIPIWQIGYGQIIDSYEIQYRGLHHSNEMRHFGFGFDTSWKSCKKCRQYDLDKHGTTYWHTWHQLPSVLECYKHNNVLEKGIEPIINLFTEVLPHQVIGWEPVQSLITKDLKSWSDFMFKINEISCERPSVVAGIQSQLIEILALDLEGSRLQPSQLAIYDLHSQYFEPFLGSELIKYIFRSYTDLTLGGRRSFLTIMFGYYIYYRVSVINPTYWIALAYWQRANLNFD